MKIILNGDTKDLQSPRSLAEVISELGMKADRIAIELNGKIIRREDWPGTSMSEGDKLEIVHFVGGGNVPGPLPSHQR